jgi:hypothetical protein
MYDAVMSVGIGACLAEQDVDGTVSSAQHQEHVRKSVFTGATGPVAFGNEATKTDVQGGRLNSTLIWAGMNMLPPQPDGDKVVSSMHSPNGLRALGFALFGTALLCSIVSAAWVFVRWKHRILRAAQPEFLYLIAFGAAVQASSIVAMSNDESYGWSTEALSHACVASAWLLPFGTLILIYGALFTKLWRVNKVLQFNCGMSTRCCSSLARGF